MALRCPITYKAMRDPVVTADGHSYERAAIERWLAQQDTSPLTGEKLPHKQLLPNYAIKSHNAELRAKAAAAEEAGGDEGSPVNRGPTGEEAEQEHARKKARTCDESGVVDTFGDACTCDESGVVNAFVDAEKDKVEQLCKMGFDEAVAITALLSHSNNFDSALNFILASLDQGD